MTRLPVPVQIPYSERLFRRSTVFYPLVGTVLGALLAFAGMLLERLLPVTPAAVVLLILWVALTGALHLDGLMDTADGLLSGRSRERMLEIMKDSRVGAMGVVAGALAILLKMSLILTLLQYTTPWLVFLIVVPMWSRWFLVWAIAGWPYARADQGMGSLFASVTRREARAATGLAFTLSLILFVVLRFHWWAAVGYTALFVLCAGFFGWAVGRRMARKLGGLTGDTYGALNEMLECLLLLVVVWIGHF